MKALRTDPAKQQRKSLDRLKASTADVIRMQGFGSTPSGSASSWPSTPSPPWRPSPRRCWPSPATRTCRWIRPISRSSRRRSAVR
jgi:hypothetical protein